MTNDNKKDRANPEFLWVLITEAAASDFVGGRYSEAVKNWQRAHRIAQGFDDCDPRRAGSLNNLALAIRINRDFDEAERAYRSALKNWGSATDWIDGMQLTQRARSSLFHLRLENKHRKKYDNIARRNYQKLVSAGHAATLNNLAELFHSTNRVKEAEPVYRQALDKRLSSMDEQEYGVVIINTNLASLAGTFEQSPAISSSGACQTKETAGFIARAAQQGWIVDSPAEFTDEGRLMAAVSLTHLIDHNRLKHFPL